ncbi:ABC1 kinase family protein [Corallococcus exercitus]|uniref:AarF/ABC1/UbiB kinase family protein n=1 Tax=Corallococcus exercitus TaxID=2316736 RepID=A0A7Y4NFK6_9BACT|nr:AarF/ABC1/UbiB kinase family protein [Corallococcus exercitus]
MRIGLKRWWELGQVARASTRLRRVSRPQDEERVRRELTQRLLGLRGLPQKVGQVLTLAELGAETPGFGSLAEAPSPLAPEDALAEVSRRLGRPWQEVFTSLEGVGIAASLGQVHRGVLRDGRAVAVKLRHPGIAEAVRDDLRALGWLAAPLGGWRGTLDMSAYRHELARMLQGELDYHHEAQALRDAGARMADVPGVAVPVPVDALTREDLLVMSWVEGASLAEGWRWSEADRRALSTTLIRLFLHGCFTWGALHADPHPGNYRVSRGPDGRPVLGVLDFGCVKPLPPELAVGLGRLISLLRGPDATPHPEQLLSAWVMLGFTPELLEPMAEALPAVSRVLLEPFLFEGPFHARSWRLGARLTEALGPHRWNFRAAGPASLLFVLRAFHGLVRHLDVLDTPIAWGPVLDEARAPSLPPPPSPPEARVEGTARYLKVRVTEAGHTRVALTFRADVTAHLEDLLPEDLPRKLTARGLDPVAIGAAAVAAGLRPSELFHLDEGDRHVRVWLE